MDTFPSSSLSFSLSLSLFIVDSIKLGIHDAGERATARARGLQSISFGRRCGESDVRVLNEEEEGRKEDCDGDDEGKKGRINASGNHKSSDIA